MCLKPIRTQFNGPASMAFIGKPMIPSWKYLELFGLGKVFMVFVCMPERNQFVILAVQDQTKAYL